MIFKVELCKKGDECCFTHSTDNNSMVEAVVRPLRRKIFTELSDEEFSLPLGHLHEVGKITTEQYHAALRKREDFEDRAGGRFQRPRQHDNSRSPRSSPSNCDSVTPEPPQRPKGSGKGDALALMNIEEDNIERQRDHTSGDHIEDEDSDREEAAAPIEVNEGEIKIETPPEPAEPEAIQTSPRKDGEDVEPTPHLEQETGHRYVNRSSDCGHRYVNRPSGGGSLNAYARNKESYDD